LQETQWVALSGTKGTLKTVIIRRGLLKQGENFIHVDGAEGYRR
jgi:hypothetical protein